MYRIKRFLVPIVFTIHTNNNPFFVELKFVRCYPIFLYEYYIYVLILLYILFDWLCNCDCVTESQMFYLILNRK